MRSSWLVFVFVFCFASGSFRPAAAQDGVPTSGSEGRSSFSSELRFRIFTSTYRWSSYLPALSGLTDTGKRSLHGVFALGVRLYPMGGHGVLIDADYRLDLDVDNSGNFICIFDCPPRLWTNLVVAHVGYAYRHVIPGPRDPTRLAWAFTPHASVSAGASYSEGNQAILQTARSPVVGARLGFDIDLHIRRFFMGWTLRYEILKHTKGPLDLSHFISWNLIPVFAMGVDLGGKLQAQGR